MQDLVEAVKGSSDGAEATWDGLGKGERARIYFRLASLKTKAGREKNIRAFVAKLERGEIRSASTTAARSAARKAPKRAASEADEDSVKEEHTQARETKKTRS
jgi:hypothetical protein